VTLSVRLPSTILSMWCRSRCLRDSWVVSSRQPHRKKELSRQHTRKSEQSWLMFQDTITSESLSKSRHLVPKPSSSYSTPRKRRSSGRLQRFFTTYLGTSKSSQSRFQSWWLATSKTSRSPRIPSNWSANLPTKLSRLEK
jgi:hypothetical protein